jgi:IS30 family transposase
LIVGYIDSVAGRREEGGRRWGVESICAQLTELGAKIAPATYYEHRGRRPTAREMTDAELKPKIAAVHAANYGVYGARKVWLTLNRERPADASPIARCTVERLMGEHGLAGAVRGKVKRTTISDPKTPKPLDLVDRNFAPLAPDRLWVADFTYCSTWSGWCYTAFVIDAYARRILGWSVATTMTSRLVVDAVEQAIWTRGREGRDLSGLVAHHDHGVQGGFNWSSQHLDDGGVCGQTSGMDDGTDGGLPMHSPGAPSHRREVEREFWREIAKGLLPEEAAIAVGASQAVGSRWFRHGGGMSPFDLQAFTGRYLSFQEREEIALLRAQGTGVREIARTLGRSPSTISRELRRNAATRGGKLHYRASVAQWKAELVARRPKTAKLVANPRLHDYVQKRLSGQIQLPDGTPVTGPATGPWTGRNKPHRKDRAWVQAWSPEQISNRLRVDFPDDESMRISHEAIYQSLYIQGRGALKRELILCLRTGRALRAPRARSRRKAWAHVTPEALISERPAGAEDRAVPGHWEGDLLIGLERSAIGTVVERTTRFTMLVHLPREEGYRHKETPKNGPALAGYGAITMKNALANKMSTLPAQLARSVTWDRGKEMSRTPSSRSRRGSRSSSPTPSHHGSVARTRTPTAYCANTSPREPTCRDGRSRSSSRSLTR